MQKAYKLKYIQGNAPDSSHTKLNSFSDKVTVSNGQSFSRMTNSSSKSLKTIMDFVYCKKNITNVEIIWTFSLTFHLSHMKVLSAMFPDGIIANNFTGKISV